MRAWCLLTSGRGGCRQGDLRHYGGPQLRLAVDHKLPTEKGNPFAHAAESYLFAPKVSLSPWYCAIKPLPPIPDSQADPLAQLRQRDVGVGGFGMLAHVSQRFLGDRVERGLDLCRQAFLP